MTPAVAHLPGIMWHVTVVLAGAPAPVERLGAALERLCALDPQNMGARYRANQVELQFWDEGHELAEVATSAAALWGNHQRDTGLPDWGVIALEVMDRDHWRVHRSDVHRAIAPGSVAALG